MVALEGAAGQSSAAAGERPAGVLRGGSWNNNSRNARAAYRNDNQPDNLNNNIGFRVVLAVHNSAVRPANPYGRDPRTGGRG